MMKQGFRLLVCVLGLTALSSTAFAQALPWEGRGFINANFVYQARSTSIVDSTQTFPIYDETGKVTTAQTIDGQAPLFDVGGGFRLFGNFGIGFAYTYLSTTGNAAVKAEVPSPIVYDQPRTSTATAGDLTHVEQGFHFQAVWMLPITDKLDVVFSGGPSAFTLKQGTILTPTVTEVGAPYTSVNLTTMMADTTATRFGFNVGADLNFRLTSIFGVGVMARYAAATFDLEPTGGAPLTVKAGGFQFGGGLRVRF